MNIETAKTISLKRLVGAAKAPDKGSTVWLCRVFGTCVAVESGMGDKGPWTRYRGDFIAKTLVPVGKDKAERAARSGELYLPPAAEDMMAAAGITPESEGQFSDFGLKIGIATDDKGRPSYCAEWIVEPEQSSPAERLVREHAPDMIGEAKEAEQTAPASKAAPTGQGSGKKR